MCYLKIRWDSVGLLDRLLMKATEAYGAVLCNFSLLQQVEGKDL